MDQQNSQPFLAPKAVIETAISELLGVCLSWTLYGCILVQFYTYCVSFPNETWRLRLLVCTIVAIETVQTVILGHFALNKFARHFGDVDYMFRIGINWINVPLLTSIVSGTVQAFLSFRIYSLCKTKALPIVLLPLTLAETVFGIAAACLGSQVGDFRRFSEVPSTAVLGALWVIVGMVVDIGITGGLVYSLVKLRSGMQRSERVIWTLIAMFVETGTLTTLAQFFMCILFWVFPHKEYHAVIGYCLSRFYAINLLTIQNSRLGLQSDLTPSTLRPATSFPVPEHGIEIGGLRFAARQPSAVPIQPKDNGRLELESTEHSGKYSLHHTVSADDLCAPKLLSSKDGRMSLQTI